MKSKDTITLELTKVVKFENLKPFGKFKIKWKSRQKFRHDIILVDDLDIFHQEMMPLTDVQDELVVKFMKKNKTDILWNDIDNSFYTRVGNGFTRVYHKKLTEYITDPVFRSLFED